MKKLHSLVLTVSWTKIAPNQQLEGQYNFQYWGLLLNSILPTLFMQLPLRHLWQHIIRDQNAAVMATGLISVTVILWRPVVF